MKRSAFALLAIVMFAACSSSWQVQRRSNMMSYLYPDEGVVAPQPTTEAKLQLPLRIGIAFVPEEPLRGRHHRGIESGIPPTAERELLEVVRKAFEGRDWVRQIVVVPTAYLTPGGGFDNLQQVARLMNVDVIALVSIDQLQTSDPRRLSFLYVSIIGAYMLPLDKNETRTMIDAAVFHVPTRTFLLRAPGTSRITGSSTAVDVGAALRERSLRGMKLAMGDLAGNLNSEVDSFKASVMAGERQDVDIYTRQGASVRGGGNFGVAGAALALLFGLGAVVVARRS